LKNNYELQELSGYNVFILKTWMNNKIFFSIIVCCFNLSRYIFSTLNSIINQNLQTQN
jgi:hypothetical protein